VALAAPLALLVAVLSPAQLDRRAAAGTLALVLVLIDALLAGRARMPI
jgi:hypothetical protein